MEFDESTQEIIFNEEDRRALGDPEIPLAERMPITHAAYVLGRAMDRLTLISHIDPSEFPAGSRKNDLKAMMTKQGAVLRSIITGLSSRDEITVAKDAEKYLRNLS